MILNLSKKGKTVEGEITLNSSKSISNRLLIIQALCEEAFEIKNISQAKDTQTLIELLAKVNQEKTLDAGAAGTTYRFLTAYLSFQQGVQILTGSQRMKERPIGILVDALRQLGAQIDYLEKEGYPPLSIDSPKQSDVNELNIPAHVSSQYISALLLIAPSLKNGLRIKLDGKIVSKPYLTMTLDLMKEYGIDYSFENNLIKVAPQSYKAKEYFVEADWSAASYYYSIAALSTEAKIKLHGLKKNSLQGDACICKIMEEFGVSTSFENNSISISKFKDPILKKFSYNFENCPDLAQSVSVVCAGKGVYAELSGLATLKIKETDRIKALKSELRKFKVAVNAKEDEIFQIGKSLVNGQLVNTYEDHRMAMAFAPLAIGSAILIEDPDVVQKSYPEFWNDLEKLGFQLKYRKA